MTYKCAKCQVGYRTYKNPTFCTTCGYDKINVDDIPKKRGLDEMPPFQKLSGTVDYYKAEIPYSDSGCCKRYWTGKFWIERTWEFDIDFRIGSHSKNWSMGSLNIDIIFFSLSFGPFDMFFAWRIKVKPPKVTIDD